MHNDTSIYSANCEEKIAVEKALSEVQKQQFPIYVHVVKLR